jgi:hypothetical protein
MAWVLALPRDPAWRDLTVNRSVERFTKIGMLRTWPAESNRTDWFAAVSAGGMALSHERTAERHLWQDRQRNFSDIPVLRRM